MPAIGLVIAYETVDKRLTGHQLNFRVQRRANRKATLIELLLAVSLLQFAPNLLGEESRGNRIRRQDTRIDHEWFSPSGARLFGGDIAVLLHALYDVVTPFDRTIAVAERVQRARLFRQCRKIGNFGDAQFVYRLVKVIERRSGDSIVRKAEINLVEIKFKNFFFRIRGLYS